MRILISLLCLLPLSALANVTVVTSIQPLHQMTSSIMQGIGKPALIIEQQASMHHFAFKPSQFSLIEQADLIIWISRDFESGFHRLPDILSKKTKSLELLDALELNHQDGHIWYSPVLLPRIASQIVQALSEVDGANAATYRRNAERLINSIKTWETAVRASIARAKPLYLLDHNFLSHFEQDMGIKATAALHNSHDQPVGILELRQIESDLRKSPVKCLLTNEPEPSKLARNLAVKFGLEIHNIMQPGDDEAQQPGLTGNLNRLRSIMQQCH